MNSPARFPLRVAVAIPTFNRDAILVDTLESVLGQAYRPDEILVIDQSASHDAATAAYLAQKGGDGTIRYLHQAPPNLPGARNRALQETTADVVIFIDDDVVLAENFVSSHLRNYSADRQVVAVAGRVKQRFTWTQRKRPSMWDRMLDYRYFNLDSDSRCEGIANFFGCNHSVGVEAARSVGGYDSNFEGAALREETDMALRLYQAGHKIVYDPLAELLHLAAPSGGCRPDNVFDTSAGEALLYFAVKHWSTLGYHVLWDLYHAFRIFVLNTADLKRPDALLFKLARFLYFSGSLILKRKSGGRKARPRPERRRDLLL
jgi:GT2 family glycosyltransferase